MKHKGNKSVETMCVEEAFIGIMGMLGARVWYETPCYTGTIDFVVGDPGEENGCMNYCGMTGVELKTTMADMRTGNGLNIRAYPYNYVLVPERMVESAKKYLEEYYGDDDHVGLLMIREEECTIEVVWLARHFSKYACIGNTKLNKAIDRFRFEDYKDSVSYYLYLADKCSCYQEHNFKSHQDSFCRVEDGETIRITSDSMAYPTMTYLIPEWRS